ncbi:MAG TPA: phosphatase PAP2 family protein [Anaerolineales bacterium]|nr:phosphatase PAP2 family protein [Anaerolineales bacterium]
MQRGLELDAAWSQRLRVAERPGLLRTLAAILAHSGDSWFWAAGLVVLIFVAPAWRYLALAMLAGILVTASMVFPIKLLVRRRRPEGEWGSIYRSTDPHSFPSGHAARAVMLTVVALVLGPAWLGIVMLVWAPLVSLARVAMGVHYLSDVVAGMFLGLLIGLAVAIIL